MLIQGPDSRIQVGSKNLFLIHITVLLQENSQFFAFGKMHIFNNIFPFRRFSLVIHFHLPDQFLKTSQIAPFYFLQAFNGVLHTPYGNLIGIPIVIDVVFVFIRTGYPEDHVFFLFSRECGPLCPETGNPGQYFQSVFFQIMIVPRYN